jgi:hypothetical protein
MMKRDSIPPGEDDLVRCPRLGHHITFSYCRVENRGLPCFRIIDCWYEHFMVEDFLRSELKPEEWEKVFNRPMKPKILSLVELIEEAKKRTKEETE